MNIPIRKQAEDNLRALQENSYPGRGLVLGLDHTSRYLVQAYWLMGRSAGSRNRIFVSEDEGRVVRTALADPQKDGGNTELTIYRAMAETASAENGWRGYVVSNGSQTEVAISGGISSGKSRLYHALEDWRYEPDVPHYTPRITGLFFLNKHGLATAEILVHKFSRILNGRVRMMYRYDDPLELMETGLCVTTYMGDDEPLPSFTGEPYPILLRGGIEEVENTLWQALNPDNRVALAVKFISRETGESQLRIVNQYEQALV